MQEDYLFVYGTLRKNYNLTLKEKVAGDITYLGQAKVAASLYDFGKYPGAIKEAGGKHEVVGDVYIVNDPEKVFSVLDEYEGYEFTREKNSIKLRSGKSITAWVYWYSRKPVEKQRIPYKDYLNYLRNKKTA
ncbi:MAG: gamma-glutamylcyclotransferase family protein [Agriterribacter sp.]